MKHVIIGTAGHIDHGKTTLIRAITGRNTDRLKEEQERGISIELGFTYFDLPSGQRAGIIDVPGHEKFIKNMLAGVIGIDIVLLVVAADEGIMPQTLEHLYILDLLGIKKGFVVLTKSDLVDSEWIDMVEEEVQEEIKGTFLENTPIIRASSTTKIGIGEIINLIDKDAAELEDKNVDDMPRLPVDRVFSISGFGTVVTGTLLSGKFKLGDEVQVFPGDKKARIRTLQVHDKDADIAYGGQRVAANLAGLKKEDISRGDTIAPVDSMKDTMMLDVKIKLLKNIDRYINNRTRLRLYIGTKEVLCRIVLLDKEEIGPGEEAYAQLRLEEGIVAKRGDKFIIRFYSPMFTIGGGEVLEPNPNKKKRFDDKAIKELEIKEMGSSTDIIENIIEEKSKEFPTTKEIAVFTAMLEENLKEEVNKLKEEKRVVSFPLTKDLHIIHINYFNKTKDEILGELRRFHSKYPLRAGMPKEEIRSRFLKNAKPKVAEAFIDLLIENGYLDQKLENISISGFEIVFDSNQLKISQDILKNFKENLYQPPRREDLESIIGGKKDEIDEVFVSLLNSGDIIKLNEEVYISKDAYDLGLKKLKGHFENKDSISIGEYRDLLNTNRKVALAILEYFDHVKITKRDKDIRILIDD
ncbi:selenocysteine-specific translation elongation factor [Tissierella praeacuta]|uniref:selenocysteine-specific translation elongation factor n=1 Tax=Tissierella praeacuta TaxID=43131 RepID=UPI00333E3188